MREIIRASVWIGFRELVEELGGDADEILAAAQVDVAALVDPERYMPLRAFIDCQAIAAERLHRKDFGLLMGAHQNLSMLGPLSIAILNSPTARQGIEICARYLHVHNPAFTLTLTPMPRTSLEFASGHAELRRSFRRQQNDERIVSALHKAMGQLGGARYRPQQVWFMHEPISAPSVYRKIFGILPLFGKPAMGIAIERAVLDAWRPGGSSQLRQIAEAYLQSISSSRHKSYTARVASMAQGLMGGGEFTPEQTGKALGVHARTLQRRLRDEGTSFEKIKDDVRRQWAESLLVQPSVSLSQIALMLDYADLSAFSRSCRRWFGEAPRTYRAQLAAGRTTKLAGPRPSRVNSLTASLRAQSRLR
jgi:AraC-like DNA-binding protein